ncbi:MAG: DUF4105 domain-containing protein [Luteimonas sp.]
MLLTVALWLLACTVAAAAQRASPSTAPASLRIGVMTMQPGAVFFERFGHDSLIVDDPAQAAPVSYNFGFFNLDEPGFLGNFARGHMTYQLVALPLDADLRYYQQVGRGVSIQWLDLSAAQAHGIAEALAINARPQNARYRYEYFTDNCATRVRDAIDTALRGGLKRQLDGRSRGNTYRSSAVRLASPAAWMWLGFDIGLGPLADQPLSMWYDAYVPMRLAEALREVKGSEGRPLVASEQVILPHRIAPEPADAPRLLWPWLLAGLAIATIALCAGRAAPRALAAVAMALWTLCALLGALMLFLWLGTEHRYAWGNHNLLLFCPLCVLLLPGGWRIARGRAAGPWFDRWLAVIASAAVVAPFLLWLALDAQRNAPWIALLLPIHLALYAALRSPRLVGDSH